MKKISLVSSCYNEEENIDVLYERTMKSIESFEKNTNLSIFCWITALLTILREN